MSKQLLVRIVLIGALPLCVALFAVTAWNHVSYTPDDTFIYLQFARNMLHGDGVAFNPGSPTYGFTSPLWLMLVATLGRTGVDLLAGAKEIDLAFAAAALIIFFLLAQEIIRERAIALLATIAFSLNIWFLRWAGTGMETSLAVFLVLATLLMTLRNSYVVASLLAGGAVLARPEAVLLVPLMLADVVLNDRDRRHAVVHASAMAGAFLLVVAPWLVFAYRQFGTIVPNTALAKAGLHFSIDELSSTAGDIGRTLLLSDGLCLVVFLAAGTMVALGARRYREGDEGVHPFIVVRQSLVPVGWLLILPLFYVLSGVNVVSRYLLLVTPVLVIMAFWYLHLAIGRTRLRRWASIAHFLLAAAMMIQSQFVYKRYVFPAVIAFEQGMSASLIPIGEWLNRNTPPSAVVYATDVGAIGYYSRRTVCDGAGLITPGALTAVHDGVTQEEMIRSGRYRELCRPDFVVDRSFEQERWKGRGDLIPLFTKPFLQMGVGDTRVNYYTVYEVIQEARQ